MAKGQKHIDKGPKKPDDTARQLKKAAGPKYLRTTTLAVPASLRPGRPGKTG